jgi:hypothetical protein
MGALSAPIADIAGIAGIADIAGIGKTRNLTGDNRDSTGFHGPEKHQPQIFADKNHWAANEREMRESKS